MHRVPHRWSNLSVGGKQFRQPTAQDGAGRTNVKRADKAGADRLNFVFRELDLLENGATSAQQGFTGLSQFDPSAGPVEKLRLELGLQRLDVLAQRWLGKIQSPSGEGEAALFGDGERRFGAGGDPFGKPMNRVVLYIGLEIRDGQRMPPPPPTEPSASPGAGRAITGKRALLIVAYRRHVTIKNNKIGGRA